MTVMIIYVAFLVVSEQRCRPFARPPLATGLSRQSQQVARVNQVKTLSPGFLKISGASPGKRLELWVP